eukprot:TRINITY_DN9600_c0_g1_i1.p1 TRINITY_DN9600_c0_g1~~TRINITY_DN9600_c0_g1_i1.p1  ORF type:complete len:161 (+),score=29.86 TRINITY_DN9600_c0_g1_i1:71-484(+)
MNYDQLLFLAEEHFPKLRHLSLNFQIFFSNNVTTHSFSSEGMMILKRKPLYSEEILTCLSRISSSLIHLKWYQNVGYPSAESKDIATRDFGDLEPSFRKVLPRVRFQLVFYTFYPCHHHKKERTLSSQMSPTNVLDQ